MIIDPTCDGMVNGLESVSCITVRCTSCGDRFENIDGSTNPHFTTVREALECIEQCGWDLGVHGLRCLDCSNNETCAADGHLWDAFEPCLCGGRNVDHMQPMEHRLCGRCGESESRPIATCASAAAERGGVRRAVVTRGLACEVAGGGRCGLCLGDFTASPVEPVSVEAMGGGR